MTGNEFKSIIAVLGATYKNFVVTDATKAQIWFDMFKDIEYQTLQLAVNKHILESEYPPTVASLRKAVMEITNPSVARLNSGDAWEEVTEAIRKCGYYNEAKALESMSPITRKTVVAMSWKELCQSTNQMADRAHFMKMFDAYKDREQNMAMLPEGINQRIEQHQKKALELVKQLSDGMNVEW